jgi:uncharacterized protein (DUF305 family)
MLKKHTNNDDMSNTNSVDKAFAIGMIKHHEMAIHMAEIILKHTDNQEVIDIANNINKLKKDEIKQMKEIINNMEK